MMTTVDPRSRMELHHALDTQLGAKEADTMMSLLPASDWNDVATKTALEAFRRGLEDRMDVRFEAVDRQIKALDARMDVRFEAVDRRFESLDARMDARFESVDRRFESVESAMRSQTRTLLFGMTGAMTAYALLILGVLRATGRL